MKEAFGEALKDSEKEKKEKIKKIILETLRKKVDLEDKVKELQKEIKILGKDLEDFKQGRLDLIKERQDVDDLARKISVLKVVKIEIEDNRSFPKPWYEPFKILPIIPEYSGPYWGTTMTTMDNNDIFNSSGTDFHNNFSGTYKVGDKIINL